MESTPGIDPTDPNIAVKDRCYSLLRALIYSSYFGDLIPDEKRLVQMTQLPRSAISEALQHLIKENLLAPDNSGYRRIFQHSPDSNGRVAFLLNTSLFTRWYGIFQDYLIGFEEVMRSAGFEVIFRSEFEKLEDKAEAIEELRSSGIRAIAFCSYAEPKLRQLVLEKRMPAVILGNATIRQPDLGCVCSDNLNGMREIVEHLIQQNHRDIAYYTSGVKSHHGFQDRHNGYEIAMRQAGLKPRTEFVFPEKHQPALAAQACQAFLNMDPQPTAIACSCDREAFELITELQKSGIRVPEDISVTGFDNNVFGGILEPGLTTVEIYARDIGRVAANYLLNEIERAQLPIHLVLPTYIVPRNSVNPVIARAESGVFTLPSKKTARITLPEEELYDF